MLPEAASGRRHWDVMVLYQAFRSPELSLWGLTCLEDLQNCGPSWQNRQREHVQTLPEFLAEWELAIASSDTLSFSRFSGGMHTISFKCFLQNTPTGHPCGWVLGFRGSQ